MGAKNCLFVVYSLSIARLTLYQIRLKWIIFGSFGVHSVPIGVFECDSACFRLLETCQRLTLTQTVAEDLLNSIERRL